MNKSNKRKRFFANVLHRNLFLLVTLAALLPTALTVVFLYHLIFGITAEEFAIPEAIAYTLIPAANRVITVLWTTMPIFILIILILAYKVTHKIVGPYDRIVRELSEFVEGKRKGPIVVRKGDKFHPLVEKINKLLGK